MLVCPVRNCRMPLARSQQRLWCERGHSFDVARSGYINLLQPQDRRSHQPGDTVAAVAARRRLHDGGVTGPLLAAIAEILCPSQSDVVLDAGCGDGFYLGSLARQAGFSGHGVDISVPAIEAAARRYPECEWIVANADRLVPYRDGSFSIVMSITARMNSSEFRRVLREDGRLVIALPSPDDLIELRGSGQDRIGANHPNIRARFHAGRSPPRNHDGGPGRRRRSRRFAFHLSAHASAAGRSDASDVQSGPAVVPPQSAALRTCQEITRVRK